MSGYLFYFNSFLLGVGLAMDAFSVSLANGLNEVKMSLKKMLVISGTFAFFQFIMPIIGWFFLHTMVGLFREWEQYIPYISLLMLLCLGSKMIWEGVKSKEENYISTQLTFFLLMTQGIATSIDALSIGFTISNYGATDALVFCLIVAITTFILCFLGIKIGKSFGVKFSDKAQFLGGIILILIGVEIFIKSLM